MKYLVALLSGIFFGAGIVISGLLEPNVIIGAVNIFGAWDPTLFIALVTASTTYGLIRILVRRRGAPLFATSFHEPTERSIDTKLAMGASLFGMAWGAAGFCPGLAFVNLGAGGGQAAFYLVGLVVGLGVVEPAHRWLRSATMAKRGAVTLARAKG